MITVEQIRQSMQIRHAKLDDDIKRYMSACSLDMQRAGVDIRKDSALMDTAKEFYCKWQFDYMGQGEKYEKSYKELRDAMSLCRLYNGKEPKDEQRSDQPDSAGEGTE